MTIIEICYLILLVSFSIQFIYITLFFSRLSFHKNNTQNNIFPISIIISARNEEDNLQQNLGVILEQDYLEFEVIVVNDRSWDDTLLILKKIKDKYQHLKIVNIPDNGTDQFGKKFALTLGIKAAQHEHMLFTDADCFPTNKFWLQEMSKGFLNNKSLVLGASGYNKIKGFLNRIIRYDTAHIAVMYLGFAKSKVPYMGVGRNLAYTKSLYEKIRGFKSHYHISSGDDDLLVNQTANSSNTSVVFGENTITISEPKKSWSSWFKQKKRHHSTNSMYKLPHQLLLTLYHTSLFSFYLSAIILLFSSPYTLLGASFLIIRHILLILIYYKPFKILLCKDLLIAIPFYEIILLICQPLFQFSLKSVRK